MNYFEITTSKEVADKIEKFFNSQVLMRDRSFKLAGIRHEHGFSVIRISALEEGALIMPDDLFWLGYYSATR